MLMHEKTCLIPILTTKDMSNFKKKGRVYFRNSGMKELPVSILYKSTAGRYRPVRVADGPITACCRVMKNASWAAINNKGYVRFQRWKNLVQKPEYKKELEPLSLLRCMLLFRSFSAIIPRTFE